MASKEFLQTWHAEAQSRYDHAVFQKIQEENEKFALAHFNKLPQPGAGIDRRFRSSCTDFEDFLPHDLFEYDYVDTSIGLPLANYLIEVGFDSNYLPTIDRIELTQSPVVLNYDYQHSDIPSGAEFALQDVSVWQSDTLFRKRNLHEFVRHVLVKGENPVHVNRSESVYSVVEERVFKNTKETISGRGVWVEFSRLVLSADNKHYLYLADDEGFLRRAYLNPLATIQEVDMYVDCGGYYLSRDVLGKCDVVDIL